MSIHPIFMDPLLYTTLWGFASCVLMVTGLPRSWVRHINGWKVRRGTR